jgi:hypothetical protein
MSLPSIAPGKFLDTGHISLIQTAIASRISDHRRHELVNFKIEMTRLKSISLDRPGIPLAKDHQRTVKLEPIPSNFRQRARSEPYREISLHIRTEAKLKLLMKPPPPKHVAPLEQVPPISTLIMNRIAVHCFELQGVSRTAYFKALNKSRAKLANEFHSKKVTTSDQRAAPVTDAACSVVTSVDIITS